MAQKITLNANTDMGTFEGGEKLLSDDLVELGLEPNADHMKIAFDNDKSVGYSICVGIVVSFLTCLWPIYPFLYACCLYGTRRWARSRVAAVTDKQLVYKEGRFGCFCCCWNESTKSVPLDKITDLQIQEGCIQRSYGIKAISVETASATKEVPQLVMVGLVNPMEVRYKILQVRDNHPMIGGTYRAPSNRNQYNPLLGPQMESTEKLQNIIETQHETMIQIKDVLQDMKTALVSMDNKMKEN